MIAECTHESEELPSRPRTRAECVGAERPCPWVSCRHHLYLDVVGGWGLQEGQTLRINHPGEPWELSESCSLDVADRGEQTLEIVGGLLHVTRERIRQIEAKALRHAQARMRRMQVDWELREAVAGEKHRPELNDPSQSVMNAPLFSAADQTKLRAVKPDVTVYRREKTPATPTEITQQETIMANKNPVADARQIEEAQEHIRTLRGMGWTWPSLAERVGIGGSTLQNIIAGRSPMSPEHHKKIVGFPLEAGPGEQRGVPRKEREGKAPALKPTKAPRATPAPKPTTQSELLARLDSKIADATEALRNAEYKLQVLRDIRAEIAGER